ncbi:MAG TPA: hypothetical protein DCS97_13425 [Planctomycetes bacterium]|nr:hypothetical protein [Planctomycetota bacterium]
MPLTISVQFPDQAGIADANPSTDIADETLFWAIWPWLHAFNDAQGEHIDVYSVYDLQSTKTSVLKDYLGQAQVAMRDSPEEISVIVGWNGPRNANPIYRHVTRTAVLALLDRLISLCDLAIRRHGHLAIIGD